MGYLLKDHRAAGGILEEWDTVGCKHCQQILKLAKRPKQREARYWCTRCNGHICQRCAATGRCEPFMRKVEAAHRSADFARRAGLQEG